MTLEFNKLADQLTALAQTAVVESAELDEKHRQALDWLHDAARRPADIRERVAAADRAKLDWHGACPPEPPDLDVLDKGIDCPDLVEPVTLIAADGSQIYPDQHAAVLYYLINIGSIVLRIGSGQAPQVSTQPHLHYRYDELYEQGALVSGPTIDAQRNLAELATLETLARQAPPPLIAIRDGSLVGSYGEMTPAARQRQQEHIAELCSALERLKTLGVTVAGYVDRTLRFDVGRMLTLGRLSADRLTPENLDPQADPLRGLNDERIFSFLAPGQRSARFILHSRLGDICAGYGIEIWFFYLNVGQQPDQPQVARIEVPGWVARDEMALNRLHAVLVQQCRILAGAPYPYALARADELAVVGAEEKEYLERLILHKLAQRNRPALPSRKARAKEQVRSGRRRHRL